MSNAIKPRERDAILQSLRAGVVPRVGVRHLQVGRAEEVAAVLEDLRRVENGGASIRFIIGRYGAGKSFFLNLARAVALERKFVVAQADITLERRLHGSTGQGRNLYAELMRNLSTRAKPEGGALANVVERWVSELDHDIRSSGGSDSDVFKEIKNRLKPLQELVSGFDFATVVGRYVEGFQAHNDSLMSSSLRWLRAEYRTKTEARQDLDVRSIIDDVQFYDYLKLFASFVRLAGYSGLLINIDEMGVFSHRLNSSQARSANYEVVLRILNDCLQGNVVGLGFLFGGTNTFLEDRRRGVFSYEALATRLADNSFAATGLKDFSGPVIRLQNLSPENIFVLLHNIRAVFALGEPAKFLISDEGIKQFMAHCGSTLGADYYLTPRDSVKAFVGLLSVIEQNPNTNWQALFKQLATDRSVDPEAGAPDADEDQTPSAPFSKTDDDLTSFRL
jgi:P-loop Domain of unknown function (DUF2791)